MQNKIQIKGNESSLWIVYDKKSKSTKFITTKGNKDLTDCEKIATVEIDEEDLKQLARYFKWCVQEIEEKKIKAEQATVKFFEDREKVDEKPKTKAKAKKK